MWLGPMVGLQYMLVANPFHSHYLFEHAPVAQTVSFNFQDNSSISIWNILKKKKSPEFAYRLAVVRGA